MDYLWCKGKRKDTKQWVEGYYVKHESRMLNCCDDNFKEGEEQHLIFKSSFADWNMPRNLESFLVDGETVCMFTGKTDKNEARIFEGDLHYDRENRLRVITFEKHMACFCSMLVSDKELGVPMHFESKSSFDIIGSIHDDGKFPQVKE